MKMIGRFFSLAVMVVGVSGLGFGGLQTHAQNGSLDLTFDPGYGILGSSRYVGSIVLQPDGKALIAGNFTSYDLVSRYRIARVNTDGGLDFTFNPGQGSSSAITDVALQNDNKILVCGNFVLFAGVLRFGIARLNANGSLDYGFDSSDWLEGFPVRSIALQPDGRIVIGAREQVSGPVYRHFITRTDGNGNRDSTFSPNYNFNNYVQVIALQSDGKILVGGYFSELLNYEGNLTSGRIARFNTDGTLDTSFHPGSGVTNLSSPSDTRILAIAIQPDEKILIGGSFDRFNGQSRTNIARLNRDGSLDTSFNSNPGPNGWIFSVLPQLDGKILIGGSFTSVGGQVRNYVARLNANGTLDTTFGSGVGPNSTVNSVAVQSDGKVLIGGSFTTVNGVTRNGIARLNCDDCAPFCANVPVPVQPTYAPCPPPRAPGKDSLIVVTHGRIPKEEGQTFPPDVPWVDEMVSKINDYLVTQNLINWSVYAFKWRINAWTTESQTVSEEVLLRAREEGVKLGRCIEPEIWSHVHMIGHSSAGALMQASINEINRNGVTEIHATFLDPFVGAIPMYGIDGVRDYGEHTDWADQYFVRDFDTFTPFNFTESPLDHAYNVDITWLYPFKTFTEHYVSTGFGVHITQCRKTIATHGYPYEFYMQTIPPTVPPDEYESFGFPLSKEGGGWNFATNEYRMLGNVPRILGTPDPPCLSLIIPQPIELPPLNLNVIPTAQSLYGVQKIDFSSFRLNTGGNQPAPFGGVKSSALLQPEPAWLSASLAVTSTVNFVSFDAYFTSTNSEGLLSVYWDTNLLDTVDERVVVSGVQRYSFELPTRYTNGIHVLGFRLDSYNATISSIIVSNIVLGFVGVAEPFLLSFTGLQTNGLQILKLDGPAGFNYTVHGSTNLIHWVPICTLVNTNGVVYFLDSSSTNYHQRFYQATVP